MFSRTTDASNLCALVKKQLGKLGCVSIWPQTELQPTAGPTPAGTPQGPCPGANYPLTSPLQLWCAPQLLSSSAQPLIPLIVQVTTSTQRFVWRPAVCWAPHSAARDGSDLLAYTDVG